MRVLVKGAIQGVSYRALVKVYALQLGILGLVRNLPDGDVEIFCEGPEERLEELLKGLYIRSAGESPLDLNVKQIIRYREGDPEYRRAWRHYHGFEIDYGDVQMSPLERESLESSELAKVQFWALKNEVHGVRDEVRDMRIEMHSVQEETRGVRDEVHGVRDEVHDMRVETHDSFDMMAEKYGSISRDLKDTKDGLTRTLDDLPERIAEAIFNGLEKRDKDSSG